MKKAKLLPPAREGAVIINLGGPAGLLDQTAGVFIDGRKVPNVTRVTLEADVADGIRVVNLTLAPGDNLSVVGYAHVRAIPAQGEHINHAHPDPDPDHAADGSGERRSPEPDGDPVPPDALD